MPNSSDCQPAAVRVTDALVERDALSRALLTATAKLAQGRDPDAVLRAICDSLVAASSHIRLAWMYLGDPNAAVIRPHYVAGPAAVFAEGLAIGQSSEERQAPIRRALVSGRPTITQIRSDAKFAPWRERALAAGLEAGASLAFGGGIGDSIIGAVAVYVDDAEYFEHIGSEPFIAFVQLGQVALAQARLRQRLQELVTVDPLTGLLNRHALQEAIQREHGRAHRLRRPYSLLLMDIDRFKLVNDNLGHQIGDQVLADVARVAQTALRNGDWMGRWGGQEFLCLLPEAGGKEAALVAERLRQMVEQAHISARGEAIPMTVSIGVASYPADGATLDTLFNAADSVLFQAKRAGRNRVMVSGGSGPALFSIVGQLETALRTGKLTAAIQPVVELKSGRVVGAEALARVVTDTAEVLDAAVFIEPASQLQLVHRIDHEIIRQTLKRCGESLDAGKKELHFVNISADLMRHPRLVDDLLERAREYYIRYCDEGAREIPVVIEITERELIGDTAEARRILAPFLDCGFRLAIDDFGSGYSSFQYLADLPISFLKIEGSLVRRVADDLQVRAIIQGIQDTATELGLTTLAECVEDRATVRVLRQIGVDWAQGYYFGAPRLIDAE